MTATDASASGGSSRLLNPRRSAHATIRGYLNQTCLGVLRWLDLEPNEIFLYGLSLFFGIRYASII